jgi:hypothetical protein
MRKTVSERARATISARIESADIATQTHVKLREKGAVERAATAWEARFREGLRLSYARAYSGARRLR